ncbi:membrane-bound lytic murein transglycosylase MltF [Thalassotalea marina]|uniref:Membrane-bound lytic murein transglycosylase F n=1 Tax=Thalassotalea marina TaxID=1673741 RepID=A0A919BK58_9GAMM|nr:membrane-bound lytic murein transglycosylase MltF [Thalassotalea marina]GHF96039.1 membrane-bound lytic murein transglycosylase F [Thalassotalea marina]
MKILVNKLSLLCVFLVCLVSFSACKQTENSQGLARIKERGFVTVGTLYGLTSYYIDAQGETGFEYELAKAYADYLGVNLKVVASYSIEELFNQLESGKVDFLAAGLTVTDIRQAKFRFSPAYNNISQKLVYKQGNKRPRTAEDLSGELVVTANSSHVETLNKLKQQSAKLNWIETADLDSEELLIRILDGEIDYTIIDSHTLAVSRRYYPEISIGFTIEQEQPLAWALPQQADDALYGTLIEFFGQVHHDGTLLALNDKYFGHVERFNLVDTRAFIQAIESKLPAYQALFEKYAQDLDWRLLAAISYQESHWNPRARSHTGVRGLMMLTLPTAKQMGVKSRLDPEQSIRGGAKYVQQMINRMPDRIPSPDRMWFALAAYNVGLGHLNDARSITKKQGGDPDRWVDVKQRLPLLKQKKYYKNTRYGYARGDEPINYVENIRRYYDTLTWIDDKKRVQQLEDKLIEQSESTITPEHSEPQKVDADKATTSAQ